jgi:competence protein ComEC
MLVCALLLGAGWWTFRQATLSPSNLLAVLGPRAGATGEGTPVGPTPVRLDGVVLSTPERARHRPGTLLPGMAPPADRFEFRVEHVGDDSVRARGVVMVTVEGGLGAMDLRAGDRAALSGMFTAPGPPANPGEFDFRVWSRDRGRVGTLSCPSGAVVRPLGHGSAGARLGGLLVRWRAALADRAGRVFGAAFGESAAEDRGEARALAMSLLLGRADPEHPEIDRAFNRLGLAHILAISGFHVVVLGWVGLQLVRLSGERGLLESVLVGALVMVYMAIVPAGAPVVRAGAMTLAMLVSESFGRRYDRLTVLGWIGLALLVWRPGDLLTLGYPLSLGLTAALLALGRVAYERLWGIELLGTLDPGGRGVAPWIWARVKELISTSVLCWTLAMPLLLCRTGAGSPLAVATTVLVTPLIIPAMALGFLMLIVGLIAPELGAALGPALSWPLRATLDLVYAMDAMPLASVRVEGVSGAWACAATVVAAVWFVRGHWRSLSMWGCALLLGVWLAVLHTRAGMLGPGVVMRLDVLAVGEGTCQILRVRDAGRTRVMMMDCGSTRTGVGRRLIPDALRSLGVGELDVVVLTSPEPGRFAALADVARTMRVGRVLVARTFAYEAEAAPTGACARLLEMLRERGASVETFGPGPDAALGPARIRAVWPVDGAPVVRRVDRSLVVHVTAAGVSALFTSDVREDAVAVLRTLGLRADVVEAPAHGAPGREAVAWIEELSPRVVVQSSGAQRADDERWDAVRERAVWLRTSKDGACWIEVDADGHVRWGSMLPRAGVSAGP